MSGYNKLAWAYDRLAEWVFRGDILNSQTHFIDLIPSNSNILIIGGGTGKGLDFINKLGITIEVDFVEPSTKMMERARTRASGYKKLRMKFIQEEFEAFQPRIQYDVICCFYFLDLFETPKLLHSLEHISNLMNRNSILLVSDFQNLHNKTWQKVLSKIMHIFFRFMTGIESRKLKDIRSLICDRGFVEINSHDFFNQFIFSAVYKKMSLKMETIQ